MHIAQPDGCVIHVVAPCNMATAPIMLHIAVKHAD
jgi:hypothetical protein